jgi:hypothetical protein
LLTDGISRHAGFVVNARFMADVQSQQLEQRQRIEALQFENERLRCVRVRCARFRLRSSPAHSACSQARQRGAGARVAACARRLLHDCAGAAAAGSVRGDDDARSPQQQRIRL